MEYKWNIDELQALALFSLHFSYNTDAADILLFRLKPQDYAALPLKQFDRLTVTDGERVVFSGIVPQGANYAEEASSGELVTIELQSDYYILEHTVYARMNDKGNAVYSRTPARTRTTTLDAVCGSVSSWLDGYLPSSLVCDASATIPTPTSTGTSPCSALLTDSLRWVPDAVLVQRYSQTGNTLKLTKPEILSDKLVFRSDSRLLQSVNLRARHDLVVPVCALIGGAHDIWPDGADIRTLGAFVYAVPVDRDTEPEASRGGAGNSAASSKMIVKGIHLPERVLFERSKEEYQTEFITEKSQAAKFVKELLPEYVDFIPYMGVSPCIVNVTPKSVLEEEIKEDDDQDAKAPANYSDNPQSWSADGKAIYVHTEGSFAASSRSSRNLRGLKWCKATLGVVFSLELVNPDLPKELYQRAQELFPGKRKSGGKAFRYVRKTISCNLIDTRRKVYDPATNQLCSTDPDFSEEEDTPEDTPTIADYKSAMAQYYAAASKLQHEGSISMLYDGSLNPAELTGRQAIVLGMRPEWETMNATIRSVDWDFQQRKLTLNLGTRAAMGFDEYLERRLVARNRGRDEAQKNALAYDIDDREAQEEQESDMSISPSVSAQTDKETSGRWHRPFSLYINEETGNVTLAGGTLQKGSLRFNVPDTEKQIVNGQPSGAEWARNKKVRLKWIKQDGKNWTFNIYQSND